jgi:excisionase family DNA binding protein
MDLTRAIGVCSGFLSNNRPLNRDNPNPAVVEFHDAIQALVDNGVDSLAGRAAEILTDNRQASRLGVTKKWLKEEVEAGRIPAIKAGTRYLFNPVVVTDVLAQRIRLESQGAQ